MNVVFYIERSANNTIFRSILDGIQPRVHFSLIRSLNIEDLINLGRVQFKTIAFLNFGVSGQIGALKWDFAQRFEISSFLEIEKMIVLENKPTNFPVPDKMACILVATINIRKLRQQKLRVKERRSRSWQKRKGGGRGGYGKASTLLLQFSFFIRIAPQSRVVLG